MIETERYGCSIELEVLYLCFTRSVLFKNHVAKKFTITKSQTQNSYTYVPFPHVLFPVLSHICLVAIGILTNTSKRDRIDLSRSQLNLD